MHTSLPGPPFTPVPFSSLVPLPPSRVRPPRLRISADGHEARMACAGRTNWWRCPLPAPGRDESSGPGIGWRRKVGKEGFEVRVGIEVGAQVQAQLMLYLSPTEWVKVGAEFDEDELWHGVVVCNPYSDWSIQHPAKEGSVFTISYDPRITTLRVFLNDIMIRKVTSFGLSLIPDPEHCEDAGAALADAEVWLGVMACSPKGPEEADEAAEAVFTNLEQREGARA